MTHKEVAPPEEMLGAGLRLMESRAKKNEDKNAVGKDEEQREAKMQYRPRDTKPTDHYRVDAGK